MQDRDLIISDNEAVCVLEDIEVMPELEKLMKFLEMKQPEELAYYRLKIDNASSDIHKLKKALDAVLLHRMKEDNVREFKVGNYKCWRGPEIKKKIKDTRTLKNMLTSENEAERELSSQSLSGGQSAWKMSKVLELQDTLGLDLVDVQKGEKIEFKMVEEKFLPNYVRKDNSKLFNI